MARATPRVFAGPVSLRASDHACVVCSSREDELAALLPYFHEGIDLGERCVYIADDVAASKAPLGGIAVEVINRTDIPGGFDPERTLDWLRTRTVDALRAGYSALRLAIEAASVVQDPNHARWSELEARLNYLMPTGRLGVLCTYDRTRLPPQVMRDMLATHSLVVTGGLVCNNPHYVLPDDFLAKDRPAGEVDRFVEQLRVAQVADTEQQERETRRRVLARGLQVMAEAERRSISRALRDEVGHTLSALELAIERGDSALDTIGLVARTLGRVNTLQQELRPPILDELGLVAAIYSHATSEATRAGFELVLGLDDLDVDGEVATACFRIAREALSNVARHARARRVEVSLQTTAGRLELVVRDDGIGFDPTQTNGTFGLLGMAQRAELVGGSVEIESSPGSGTTIVVRIP